MAENWNDYGDYGAEEEYRSRSLAGKIFSGRTLKNILKAFIYLLLISLYLMLFFRLCTNGPSVKMKKLLKTDADISAYAENGKLSVFSQELDAFITNDGAFAVYDVRLILETNELQFTVRYNNSTADALRDKLSEEYKFDREKFLEEYKKSNGLDDVRNDEILSMTEYTLALSEAMKAADEIAAKALAEVTDRPFVFALRDEDGNVYTSYACAEYSKNFYQYLRVAFVIPDLFDSESLSPELLYPSPDANDPLYIYKGVNAGYAGDEIIKTLSLEMYYENDVDLDGGHFGDSLVVYRSEKTVESYDFKKEMNGGVTEGIKYVDIKTLIDN